MTPLITERVEQSVNSGLIFFIMKSDQKYYNFYTFSMFYGHHSDFIFSEVYYRIFQKGVVLCQL